MGDDGFSAMGEEELRKLYESLALAMTCKNFQNIQHSFAEDEK